MEDAGYGKVFQESVLTDGISGGTEHEQKLQGNTLQATRVFSCTGGQLIKKLIKKDGRGAWVNQCQGGKRLGRAQASYWLINNLIIFIQL